ncbi:putative P-type phospholipid transporter [Helianthus annuus]|nr:putative P-type phospholipid transporter [Helianthus annuus]
MPFYRRKDYSEGQVENYNYYGLGMEIFFTFLMSVIVFQIMIPISLYISMELVRVGQAYFMIRDDKMYDATSNTRFQCRALNINEDLGQIKYVFSDKTGTLTENKMEFQFASISGVDYSGEKTEFTVKKGDTAFKIWKPKMKVQVDPNLLKLSKSRNDTKSSKDIYDFFLALAACNTIVPIVANTSNPNEKLIDYQGESPDEQALVYAAAAYGFMLIERTSGHIVIDIQGERQRFNVLGMHEFDSDRKRMSVILGYPDSTVKVFVKGADTTMFKVIDESLNLDVNNLSLLGASAIEDRLQKGVPEAIESLRKANIKVWVLTGDKQETAISIGYSSKLLTSKMTQIVINNNSKMTCQRS